MGRKKKTTYEKGQELEIVFAGYMKEKLEYDKITIRPHVAQGLNKRGCEVDIIAKRMNKTGEALRKVFWAYLVIFIGLAIIALMFWEEEWSEQIVYVALVFEVAAIIALIISEIHNKENAWVECKNLQNKANINQISKMVREVEDYKRSGDKEYKFKELFFVSNNGFVNNALDYAIQHDIKCFVQTKNNDFEEIKKWN